MDGCASETALVEVHFAISGGLYAPRKSRPPVAGRFWANFRATARRSKTPAACVAGV